MKRCPICDELIEEHLQVCPYCDEETGFEPETISKKECPVCGELIDEALTICPVCGEDITPQVNSEHTLKSVVDETEHVQELEKELEPITINKKECPICGELIEEALMVCPVCGEDITPQTNTEYASESVGEEPKLVKGSEQESEVTPEPIVEPQPEPAQALEPIVEESEFVQEPEEEPETEIISKKECPVCGELINETLLVCPVCGEDITPQTNSEHASGSIVEEAELVQGPIQVPEVIPEPVVVPQPGPTPAPEPIVKEPKPIVAPQPKMVPKAEPEPIVRPVPPTVSKVAPQISVPEDPQKEIPMYASKKTNPLLYVIISLLVIIIAILIIILFRNPKSETGDKPAISQTEIVEEIPLTIPELLDSIAKMLPSGGQLIARFPDEARHCLYYLADNKLFCYDAEENMSEPISVMREGFEVDVLSAHLLEDRSTILLKVEDIRGKVLNYKLDTNTKNVMEVVVETSIK